MTSSIFAVIRTRGPAWTEGAGLEAQAGWLAHAAFMDRLHDEGMALLVGPLEGTREALLILKADGPAEIVARLAEDPWTLSGHLATTLIAPWTLRLGALG